MAQIVSCSRPTGVPAFSSWDRLQRSSSRLSSNKISVLEGFIQGQMGLDHPSVPPRGDCDLEGRKKAEKINNDLRIPSSTAASGWQQAEVQRESAHPQDRVLRMPLLDYYNPEKTCEVPGGNTGAHKLRCAQEIEVLRSHCPALYRFWNISEIQRRFSSLQAAPLALLLHFLFAQPLSTTAYPSCRKEEIKFSEIIYIFYKP